MKVYRITTDSKVPSEAAVLRMLKATDFQPFPPAADRRAWSEIAARPWVRPGVKPIVKSAERAAAQPSPQLKATDFAAFVREGTRGPYAAGAGPRRGRLAQFVAAECFEHKGRFLDAILDETWLIAEESAWVMSAHMREMDTLVPDFERLVIDLGAAHAGQLFGESLYLVGREMDDVTPRWRARVNYEIRRRIVEPYLNGFFWWEEAEMNWNSVCLCGVAAATLCSDLDIGIKARVLQKVIREAPAFLRGFTADGGCTEGPGYWNYGTSNFAALAYYVDRATGGAVDLLADPICRPAFEYPTKMILTGSQVVAFADCGLRAGFAGGATAWAAARLGADDMVALASVRKKGSSVSTSPINLLLSGPARRFKPPRDAWLPNLQVMNSRGRGRDGQQLVLAAKAGNNGEVHNHNDVGSFVINWQGESLICELGAGEYIRQLFSSRRYELLFTRSLGHNVPLLNGVEQGTGKDFCATDLCYEADGKRVTMSMDIARAYPKKAGVKRLVRTLSLRRGKEESVELTDQVVFSGDKRAYELPLYTVGRFRLSANGALSVAGGSGRMEIEYDPSAVAPRIEAVPNSDARLAGVFGDSISRCTFKLGGKPGEAAIDLRFIPQR